MAVACTIDTMLIGINPLTTTAFGGVAYIKDKRTEGACTGVGVPATPVVTDTIPDTWKGLYIEAPHSSATCGIILPEKVINACILLKFYS